MEITPLVPVFGFISMTFSIMQQLQKGNALTKNDFAITCFEIWFCFKNLWLFLHLLSFKLFNFMKYYQSDK